MSSLEIFLILTYFLCFSTQLHMKKNVEIRHVHFSANHVKLNQNPAQNQVSLKF